MNKDRDIKRKPQKRCIFIYQKVPLFVNACDKEVQMERVKWADFEHNVEKIAKCHNEIDPAFLAEGGKYHKSYTVLKKMVIEQLREILPQVVYSEIRFRKEDSEAVIDQIREFVQARKDDGFIQRIRDAAIKECNPELVMNLMVELHNGVVREYGQYWLDNCVKCNMPEYSHYNKVIRMYYSPEYKIWRDAATPDGRFEFGIFYPPTREEYYAEYPAW